MLLRAGKECRAILRQLNQQFSDHENSSRTLVGGAHAVTAATKQQQQPVQQSQHQRQ
jgi:hypothetical protein